MATALPLLGLLYGENDVVSAIRNDACSSAEISAVKRELERADLPRSRAGIRHAMRNSAVVKVASPGRLLGVAREFLGGEAIPYRATLFDRSPISNWLLTWHQDTALPLCEKRETAGWGPWSVKGNVVYARAPPRVLSDVPALRLHLDDSATDNGPLRVLPRTHTPGIR